MINIWIAFSQQAVNQYNLYRDDPSGYIGPMDMRTFNIMRTMHNQELIFGLFKTPSVGGKTYFMYSIYTDNDKAETAVSYITSQWPDHIIVLGAWSYETGLQLGLSLVGEDIVGTPVFNIHSQAWKLMPDLVEYDEAGSELSRTAASTNSDLRDVCVLAGQAKRVFA